MQNGGYPLVIVHNPVRLAILLIPHPENCDTLYNRLCPIIEATIVPKMDIMLKSIKSLYLSSFCNYYLNGNINWCCLNSALFGCTLLNHYSLSIFLFYFFFPVFTLLLLSSCFYSSVSALLFLLSCFCSLVFFPSSHFYFLCPILSFHHPFFLYPHFLPAVSRRVPGSGG